MVKAGVGCTRRVILYGRESAACKKSTGMGSSGRDADDRESCCRRLSWRLVLAVTRDTVAASQATRRGYWQSSRWRVQRPHFGLASSHLTFDVLQCRRPGSASATKSRMREKERERERQGEQEREERLTCSGGSRCGPLGRGEETAWASAVADRPRRARCWQRRPRLGAPWALGMTMMAASRLRIGTRVVGGAAAVRSNRLPCQIVPTGMEPAGRQAGKQPRQARGCPKRTWPHGSLHLRPPDSVLPNPGPLGPRRAMIQHPDS